METEEDGPTTTTLLSGGGTPSPSTSQPPPSAPPTSLSAPEDLSGTVAAAQLAQVYLTRRTYAYMRDSLFLVKSR